MLTEATIYILYLVNGLLLALGFMIALQRRRVYSVIVAALLLLHLVAIFGMGAVITEFGATTVAYGQALMVGGNSTLVAMLMLLDNILIGSRRLSTANLELGGAHAAQLTRRFFMVVLLLAAFAILIKFRGGLGIVFSNWQQQRASLGFVDALSQLLSFVFFPAVWLAFRERKFIVFGLLLVACLAYFQISGSRAMALTIPAAMYFELLLARRRMAQKLLLLVVLGILGFTMHTAERLLRGYGLSLFFGNVDLRMVFADNVDWSGGESAIYRYYSYVVEKGYTEYPYRSGVTLLRLALLYVPRSFVPELKPNDLTYQIWYNALQDGIFDTNQYIATLRQNAATGQLGSLHPTFWGDAYANIGWAGVVLYGMLFAYILVLIDVGSLRLNLYGVMTLLPIVAIGYLMIARGNIVIGFNYIGYSVPIAAAALWATRIPIVRRRSIAGSLPSGSPEVST